jgi:hypothetical protein
VTITRAQVADLRKGDIVELQRASYPDVVMRGPVRVDSDGRASIGGLLLRYSDGAPGYSDCTLTVVSRAPRPLYVNHPRTEPVEEDIVRDCDGDGWSFKGGEWWCASPDSADDDDPAALPISSYRPLTLLWDGETGQVVP